MDVSGSSVFFEVLLLCGLVKEVAQSNLLLKLHTTNTKETEKPGAWSE